MAGVHGRMHPLSTLQPHQRAARRRLLDHAGQDVHPGTADEAGHEQVGGVFVQLKRRADLLDHAASQHHDAVGQGHGLDLVVGDIDHGRAQRAMQARELVAHLDPQGGVQVRQGLVKQEHLRLAHDGAADGDALALTAGEGFGLAVQFARDVQHLGGGANAAVDLALVRLGQRQAERHVLVHRHVRIERIGLEHHGDAALRRLGVIDAASADGDLAGVGRLQPGDGAQEGGLATAGWAHKHHELAVGDRKVQPLQHPCFAEALLDARKLDVRHLSVTCAALTAL